jgi:NADH-quinone oxidoreductase subunit A
LSYTEQYFPVLVQALLAMALAAGLLTASYLLGKRVRNRVKDMPYESGIVPTGDARQRFSVKFYLVAMLFILFDIEAIFLYPVGGGVSRTEDVRRSSRCWCSWC